MQKATFAELTRIFRDVFDDPGLVLTPATSPGDIPAWDSGKAVMLILAVEDSFRVTLKAKEIDRLRTVGDWGRLLEARAVHG